MKICATVQGERVTSSAIIDVTLRNPFDWVCSTVTGVSFIPTSLVNVCEDRG